jgi:hypothetical protein
MTDPEYKENCQCDACRQDRDRRRRVPMWDYIRTYMKIQGVHYDRYTPKQAAELIAKANDAGEEIPDDLAMLEGVVRLQRGDFDDMLRRRYHGAGESRKTELATKKGAER